MRLRGKIIVLLGPWCIAVALFLLANGLIGRPNAFYRLVEY